MFEIQFFNYTHGKEVVDKTKYLSSTPLTLTGTLKEETSIINPVIIVEGNILSYNYCYIPIFNRFYYITNISSHVNNLWKMSLHVDVLNTYKSGIYFMPCCVERNETHYNTFLEDNRMDFLPPQIEYSEVSTGNLFNNNWSYAVGGLQLSTY